MASNSAVEVAARPGFSALVAQQVKGGHHQA
jgi:hypothetical protein